MFVHLFVVNEKVVTKLTTKWQSYKEDLYKFLRTDIIIFLRVIRGTLLM